MVISALAVVQVPAPAFTERLLPDALTSGEDVLGVLSDPLTGELATTISVSGVARQDAFLCGQLRSVSGLYQAAFKIPNPQQGASVSLRLPSAEIPRLKKVAGEVAVRVRSAPDAACRNAGPFLPVAWGSSAPGSTVSLLVNSRQADRTRVQVSGGRLVDCQTIGTAIQNPGVGARAYDSVCRVILQGACASEAAVTIARYDSNSIRPPLDIRARVPC